MITLYTAGTPNGQKISIFLEEAGLPYHVHAMNLGQLDQKQEWFLKINPNGRIPAIIDHDADDFAVFESGAILLYLAEKTGQFLPSDPLKRSQVLQWVFFQVSGLGPMQGQANVFYRYAPEKIPYAIERYQKETRRLYEVLERQLEGRDYLVDEYSIADMACYPWVKVHDWAGIDMTGLVNVQAWLQRVGTRPGILAGLAVPEKREATDAKEVVAAAKKMI